MRTVLLVDDHVLFRESLALLLRQRLPELRVLEAGSLHLALRQCERHPDIDLIVLDLMLRDSRGVLTLERLRRACPGTAVVVVSGATVCGGFGRSSGWKANRIGSSNSGSASISPQL